MKEFDVVVLGAGCGLEIVERASMAGYQVALVEPSLLGGTCVNLGCIPSKMLIAPADMIVEQERAARLGVTIRIDHIDFASIMIRMRTARAESQMHLEHSLSHFESVTRYPAAASYIEPGVLQVGDETIRGKQVFIAVGARPFIPSIEGLPEVDYLTNDSVLELSELPKSLVIVGGGYVAVEYCHFFAAMGTRVTLLEMADRLVTSEEPEISAVLQAELSKRAHVVTGTVVKSASRNGEGVRVVTRARGATHDTTYQAEKVLIAAGRQSNADTLQVNTGGVVTDAIGYVEVDGHMRTNQQGVFAIGDINGKSMFRHAANVQALVAAANAFDGQKIEMDYRAIPHAIYSYPQIASVGLTETQARNAGYDIAVSLTSYSDVAKGEAIAEEVGFTKCIVNRDPEEILGFHIIGPYAPILIQEVVNAMQSGGHVDEIARAIHIHPAMPELIPSSFGDLA